MSTFNFSTQLHHLRKGRPFTGASLGFPVALFHDEEDWKQPLLVGTVVELVLLYGNPTKEDSPKEKRCRFAAALKVRDCGVDVELTPEDERTIREACAALSVEPYGLVLAFLDGH